MAKMKWAKYESVAGDKYCNPPNRTGLIGSRAEFNAMPKDSYHIIYVSKQGVLNYYTNGYQNLPKDNIFNKSGAFYYSVQFNDGSVALANNYAISPYEGARYEWRVYPSDVLIPYSKGEFIANVTAEASTYPAEGRHSDGFWYVLLGNATNAAVNIDGIYREVEQFVNVDGIYRPVEAFTNVDGIYRQ